MSVPTTIFLPIIEGEISFSHSARREHFRAPPLDLGVRQYQYSPASRRPYLRLPGHVCYRIDARLHRRVDRGLEVDKLCDDLGLDPQGLVDGFGCMISHS
jgi:phosphatidylserine/phosphatidylglycerophosphate/cardiolipin synthase-like enzyme